MRYLERAGISDVANENGIDTFAKLPINPDNAALVDSRSS